MAITTTVAADLVTSDDLAAFPGAAFDPTSVELAAATVRGACHWHIAPTAEVVYAVDQSHRSDVLMLDALRIGTVVEVIDNRTGLVVPTFRVSPSGAIQLPYAIEAGINVATVKVNVGYAECPIEIKGVVAELAWAHQASRTRPPNVRSRTVGGVSYTWVTPDTKLVADPLARFSHILRRYTV